MIQRLIKATSSLPISGLFHLSIVYTVWSSTYVAIRIAVSEGGGFTPFALSTSRMFVAGLILLLYSCIRSNRITPTKNELYSLAISGTLLWVGGRGLIIWSEQYATSCIAALITATTPLWTLLCNSFIQKEKPSLPLSLSILVGFLGTIVLVIPTLYSGSTPDITAVFTLLAAAICWSLGSIYQVRNPVNFCSAASSGWQQLIASFVFLFLAVIFEEPFPTPTTNGWLAWIHLTIFCSVIAFTSYISALRLLPINIVMTSAYVNPIIATLLGFLLLKESVTTWTLAGAFFIIFSITATFYTQDRSDAHSINSNSANR